MEAGGTSSSGSGSHGNVTMAKGALAMFLVYMGVVQLFRFRRIRRLRRSLDAKKDASAVFRQMASLEFPFMVTKSLEFALFATYGVPSISKLLHKTGEFEKRVGKRYDGTDLILREYYENDTSNTRVETAMSRMNAIHGIYSKEISNADMLYTLSLFITSPKTWIDRFGWRRCTDFEKEALLIHFSEMGRRMGIKGIDSWKTWEDVDAFQAAYAAEHLRFATSNVAIAGVTVDLFVSLLPKPLQAAARWPVYALIDPPLLKAFGFPQAPILLQWFMKATLLARAMTIRFLMLPRPDFLFVRRTALSDDSTAGSADVLLKPRFCPFSDAQLGCLVHKDGYKIADLGPDACPAGKLFAGMPSYTGSGGGGSGNVVLKPDGTPLVLRTHFSASDGGAESKKSA